MKNEGRILRSAFAEVVAKQNVFDGKYFVASGNPEQIGYLEADGIVAPDDVVDVQAVSIMDTVLGLARPQYKLRQLCRVVPMDQLTMRADIGTGLTGQRKVPPLVEADIKAESYTPVNFDLWKNVVHVALADETQKKAKHPLMNLHITDAGRDLPRMENLDIKDELEANISEKVPTIPYSDWGAQSGGVSTTDPFDAIIASINYIQGKGYPVDFLAMHPTLFGKFIRNTWVRDLVHAGIANLSATGGYFTLPGYPTVKIVTDYALTETPTSSVGPIVGSSIAPGAVLGLGPTMAEKWRSGKAGYDAYSIRQWLQPKVVLDDALDMICA